MVKYLSQNTLNVISKISDIVIPAISDDKKDNISQFFKSILNSFTAWNSENKIEKKLIDLDIFASPSEFLIQSRTGIVTNKGMANFGEDKIKGVLMPIQFQIKTYFQLPNVLDSTIKQLEKYKVSKNIGGIENFVQGHLWQSKTNNLGDKIAISYFLYYDDFEVNDTIGHHTCCQSIAEFYYKFPLTPTDKISKLEYISPAQFLKFETLRKLGPNTCL